MTHTVAGGMAIVLAEGELTQWRSDVLGVSALRRLGLEVIYVDCEPFLRPKHKSRRPLASLDYDLRKVRELLNAHRHRYVFSFYDLSDERLRPILHLLGPGGTPWCRVFAGCIPDPSRPQGFLSRASLLWFQLSRLARQDGALRATATAVRNRTSRLLGFSSNIYPPKYVLLEGLAAQERSRLIRAIPVAGHSRDYERALASDLLALRPKAEDYCVFLDSNEARHEDFGIFGFGRRDVVDETWYREGLQRSFKAIQEATGLDVVIAPHPRYHYPDGYFGSYEVREGDTTKTVASSKLVIGHYSTSIGMAAIFRKPVILLNSRPMMKLAGGHAGRYIAGFQKALGCPMLDMDNPDLALIRSWKAINETQYAEYRDHYVKFPGGPEGSMWENAVRTIAQHEGWDVWPPAQPIDPSASRGNLLLP